MCFPHARHEDLWSAIVKACRLPCSTANFRGVEFHILRSCTCSTEVLDGAALTSTVCPSICVVIKITESILVVQL